MTRAPFLDSGSRLCSGWRSARTARFRQGRSSAASVSNPKFAISRTARSIASWSSGGPSSRTSPLVGGPYSDTGSSKIMSSEAPHARAGLIPRPSSSGGLSGPIVARALNSASNMLVRAASSGVWRAFIAACSVRGIEDTPGRTASPMCVAPTSSGWAYGRVPLPNWNGNADHLKSDSDD
jgi:hypothetical protein